MSQGQREEIMAADLAQLGTSLLLWLDGDEADLERNIMDEKGLLPLLPLDEEGAGDG